MAGFAYAPIGLMALVRYVSPHVLIIDEVGYLTYSHDPANVLYHVVTQRHQARRSSIV